MKATVISAGIRVPIDGISVAEDSGWRDLVPERVTELIEDVIKSGDWGSSILAGPKLVVDSHKKRVESSHDGLWILDDGKHIVKALQQVWEEFEETVDTDDQPAWLDGELLTVFRDGLRVDEVQYPSDDKADRVAIQCLNHEVDQNKYQATSIADKAALVHQFRKKASLVQSPDMLADWADVAKAIVAILGDAKRPTVHLMIVV